jgi:hypothetical protein
MRIHGTAPLRLALWSLFAAPLLFCAAAFADTARELRPAASGDDTAQLQAALSRCANPKRPCDLRLGAGVFHTDVLLVSGFVGSITGRGQGRTVIRPVLDRPLRATARPYFSDPTPEQPYPILMHFTDNSRVTISRLTFDIPAAMTVQPYSLFYSENVTNALMAAVSVDGDGRAALRMTQTSFKGADNDSYFGNNLSFAAILEGQIRVTDEADLTRRLRHGRFWIYNNRVQRAGNAFMVRVGDGVDAFIASNLVDTRVYGLYTEDLGASNFTAVHNNISADSDGIAIGQTPFQAPAVPSDYVIAQNKINVNVEGDAFYLPANDGVAMFDASGASETIDADVAIFGNDIQMGPDTFQGITIISASGDGDVRVVGNRLRGNEPLDAGVWVELSRGALVAGNEMSEIHPRLGDVALLDTTRDCRVFEPGDTYTDEGVNNIVNGNRGPSSALRSALTTRAAARSRPLLH